MSTPCERIIPGQVDSDLYNEHLSRYLFTKQFIKDKKVLDLGCGTGYGSKVMAEVARKVVGVDISRDAINYAKEHFNTTNVFFHIQDCSRLGLADKSFDVVVSFEVIEHIKDYTGLIREAKRVLIDTGIFILSTPNKRYTEEKGETNPYHTHEFYYDELDHLLKKFFGQVQIMAENHCQGIYISSPLCKKGYIQFPQSDATKDNFLKTSSYFIAVCYQRTKSVPEIKKLFYIPSEANILREKEHHIKALQEQLKEFDKRTEWAIKLDAELREKAEWAHNLDIELQDKNKYLAQLQHEFEERNKYVEKLNKDLEEKNQTLLQLQREFDERTKWALKFDAELKEKDKYLGKLQHEFDEKVKWVSQLDAELEKTNKLLTNLRQELEERSKWAINLDAELKERNEYIRHLHLEFEEKTKWAAKLDAELKDKIALLHTLNQLLQEKDQTIIPLQEDLKKKASSLAGLQKELQSLKNTKLYKLGKKIKLIK